MQTVMAHTTLRHMAAAQKLWRDHPGADGRKFQEALADGDMEAVAAILAAKLDVTVDEALDLELDDSEDEPSGGSKGNSTIGAPRVPLPVNGN